MWKYCYSIGCFCLLLMPMATAKSRKISKVKLSACEKSALGHKYRLHFLCCDFEHSPHHSHQDARGKGHLV